MRASVTIRQFSLNYSELKTKIEEIEQKFPDIYNALNFLMNKDKAKDSQEERIQIGYKK
jgi:hypothetical protein